jgi:hypothetical protein
LTTADSSRTSDDAALLDLHERDRRAHLTGDATLLASGVGEMLTDSSRGRIQRLSRDDFRERFADYFQQVRYARWEDVEPPVVTVSADGSQAWMAIHIQAELTTLEGQARRFDSSWIAIYEKDAEGWRMVGIASSVLDVD